MKNRKLVALICALAMVLGMFAACGPATEAPATSTPEATQTVKPTATPTVAPTEPPLVQDDYFKFNFFDYDKLNYGKNEENKTWWLASVELKEGVDLAKAATFTELVIPAEYEGWTIDGLGDGYADGKHFFSLLPEEVKIEKITIPSSVTYIEFQAFNGAENLAEVEYEDVTKITAIGGRAFHGTTYAKNALEAEGQLVINNILCLTAQTGDVVIPEGIVAIPDGPFGMNSREDIEGITSITLPASATTLHGVTDDIRDLAQGGTMTEDEYLAKVTVKVPYGSKAHTEWAPQRGRTCVIEVINVPYTFDVVEYSNGNFLSYIKTTEVDPATVTELVIPATYNGLTISGWDWSFDPAGAGFTNIKKLVVECNEFYAYGSLAFANYAALEEVEFANVNGVKWKGELCFANTPWFKNYAAANGGVVVLGSSIWGFTTGEDLVIPEGVTMICDGLFTSFEDFSQVKTLTFPKNDLEKTTWIFQGIEDFSNLTLKYYAGTDGEEWCKAEGPGNNIQIHEIAEYTFDVVEYSNGNFLSYIKAGEVDPATVTTLVIPAEYNGLTISGWDWSFDPAGAGFTNIKTLVVECNEFYAYGSLAFANYAALEDVQFANVDGVKWKGELCFANTPWFKNYAADNGGVVVLGSSIWGFTTGKYLTIPNGVTMICDGLFTSFDDFSQVESIRFPQNPLEKTTWIFQGVEDLSKVVLEYYAGTDGEVWCKAEGPGNNIQIKEVIDYDYTWEIMWKNDENKTASVDYAVARDGVDPDSITELVIPEYVDGYKITGAAGTIVGSLKNVKKLVLSKNFTGFFMTSLAGNQTIEEIVMEGEDRYIHAAEDALVGSKWFNDQAAKNNGFAVIGSTVVGIAKGGDVIIPEGIKYITDGAFRGFDLTTVKSLTLPSTFGTEYKNILSRLSADTKKAMTIYYYPNTNGAQWVENWKDEGYTAAIANQAKYSFTEFTDFVPQGVDPNTQCWVGDVVLNEGYDKSEVTEIIFPTTINGKEVVGIGNAGSADGIFKTLIDAGCTIEKVVIPANIKEFDYFIFKDYASIKEFVFEDASTITFVANQAFTGTQWAKDVAAANGGFVVIGNQLVAVTAQAIVDGTVTFPANAEVVIDGIFNAMTKDEQATFNKVVFPKNIKDARNIWDSYNKEDIANKTVVVEWGTGGYAWAFAGYGKNEARPFNLEILNEKPYTFELFTDYEKDDTLKTSWIGKVTLKEGVDPATVTEIVIPSAWYGNKKDSNDVIVYNIHGVGNDTFDNIKDCKIEKIYIPATVKEFDYNAFVGATTVKEVVWEDASTAEFFAFNAFNDTQWAKDQAAANNGVFIVNNQVLGISATGDVKIPEGVTLLNDKLFQLNDFAGCKSITIPESVTLARNIFDGIAADVKANIVVRVYEGSYAATTWAPDFGSNGTFITEVLSSAKTNINVGGTTVAPNMNAIDYTWGTAIRVDKKTFNAGIHNHEGATSEDVSMDLYLKHDANYVYIGMVSPDADVRGSSESWKGDGVQFKIGTASQKNIYFTVNEDKVGFSGADDYNRNMWVANGNLYATIAVPLSAIDVVDGRIEFTFLRISGTAASDYAGWLTYGNFFTNENAVVGADDPNYLVLTNDGAADIIATGTTSKPNFNAIDASWGTAIRVDNNTYNAGIHNHEGATSENVSMDLYIKHDADYVYIGMVSPDADVRGSSESWKGDGVQFKIGTASQKNIYFTVNEDKIGFSGADDYTRNMWVADGNIYATIAVPFSAIDVVDGKIEFTFLRISGTAASDYAGWLTYGNFFTNENAVAGADVPCYIVLSDVGMTDIVAGKVDAAPNMEAIDDTWGTAIRVDNNTYNAGIHNHEGATSENVSMDLYIKHDADYVYIGMVSPDADVRGSSESWKGDGVQFKIGTASQKNIYFTVNEDKAGFSGADDYTRNMWVADGNLYATIAVPFDAIDVVDGKIELTFLRISSTAASDYAGWLTYGNFFTNENAVEGADAPCYIVLG